MIDAGEKKSPTTNAFALEAMFATPMDFQFTVHSLPFLLFVLWLYEDIWDIFSNMPLKMWNKYEKWFAYFSCQPTIFTNGTKHTVFFSVVDSIVCNNLASHFNEIHIIFDRDFFL